MLHAARMLTIQNWILKESGLSITLLLNIWLKATSASLLVITVILSVSEGQNTVAINYSGQLVQEAQDLNAPATTTVDCAYFSDPGSWQKTCWWDTLRCRLRKTTLSVRSSTTVRTKLLVNGKLTFSIDAFTWALCRSPDSVQCTSRSSPDSTNISHGVRLRSVITEHSKG